ncbi:MAG TPA: hypothetical protein V6C65_18900, partial [Allocoleopsis sp.]
RKLWASMLVYSGPYAQQDDEILVDTHNLGEAIPYLIRRRKKPAGDTFLSYADLQNVLLRKKRSECPEKQIYEIGAPRAVWDKAIAAVIDLEQQFSNM